MPLNPGLNWIASNSASEADPSASELGAYARVFFGVEPVGVLFPFVAEYALPGNHAMRVTNEGVSTSPGQA